MVQLETLSSQLRLSPSTAAITLLALGNSSPDVFSDIAAVQGNGDFNLAIGELVGASMFLTTVVLSAVILYATARKKDVDQQPLAPRPECKVDKTPIRDIVSFFIVLIAILIFSITDGKITFAEATMLIGAYVVYVICVVVYTKFYENPKKLHRRRSMFGSMVSSSGSGSRGYGSNDMLSQRKTMEEALLASAMQSVTSLNGDDESDEDEECKLVFGLCVVCSLHACAFLSSAYMVV